MVANRRGNVASVSFPTDEELKEWEDDEALEQQIALRDKSTELEPLKDSPALNRLLLRNARKSLREIAEATGLNVAEAGERLSTLLDNRSWRDDLMEEKLLLAELGLLLEDVRTRMNRSLDDEAWAQMARINLKVIDTLLTQLDRRRKAVDGKLASLTKEEARRVGIAIQMAQEMAVQSIKAEYPDLDAEVIYVHFERALPKAIEYLESQVDEDAL